jgi:hypothetical protein
MPVVVIEVFGDSVALRALRCPRAPGAGPGVAVVGGAAHRRDALFEAAGVGERIAGHDGIPARFVAVPESLPAGRIAQ